ncbi:MAG: TIGR04053 family radical SAM/SPASM domain-containing protein [Actinomycetia bacterium]|nr:TIGR04053 family radical SAM/SPASM domain-containing protein [Actinomycetes bacterium]
MRTRTVRQQRNDPSQRPFIVIWEVTRACQLACRHCRADAITRAHPRQLTLDEGRRLLDQVASFPKPHPLVVLTGGDPFEREDLAELVRYGTEIGLSVSLSPSVTPKLVPERLAELREAGGKAVSLSLDGARAATHDAFRGFAGTYAATRAAARMIRDAGFRLQVNSTVTSSTVLELPALMSDVIGLGAALWSVFFVVPTGRAARESMLSPDQTEDVLQWLADMSHRIAIKTTEAPHYRRVVLQRAAGVTPQTGALYDQLTELSQSELRDHPVPERPARPPIDVNAGRGFVFVSHVGEVFPSGFLPHSVGDIRTTTLPEIYRDSPLMRQLRTPSSFGGRCGRCEYGEVCGGSRSRAYALTRDLLAEDPACAYEPALEPSRA